jgi:hypothetical protein
MTSNGNICTQQAISQRQTSQDNGQARYFLSGNALFFLPEATQCITLYVLLLEAHTEEREGPRQVPAKPGTTTSEVQQ